MPAAKTLNAPTSESVRVYRDGDRVKIAIPAAVRDEQICLHELLPIARRITDAVVQAAELRESKQARKISCKAGCGACCRQLVPIAVAEAQQLQTIIEGMSEERRRRVEAQFTSIREALREAGLADKAANLGAVTSSERRALSFAYLGLRKACPFLENESCSIHQHRPLICRQYLVTSHSDYCRVPTPETITRVSIAAEVNVAIRDLEAEEYGTDFVALALLQDVDPTMVSKKRTLSEWLKRLIQQLRSNDVQSGAAPKPPPAT